MGGIVVDDQGKPVEGAQAHPSIEFKKRPGDLSQFVVGATIKTDAAGKWRFDSVPASKSDLFVTIRHPGYRTDRLSLSRRQYGLELSQQPTARIVLDRGLTVTGLVTDAAGQPIADALVRTKFFNDLREAKTDADGVYRLKACEPRMARIVISAAGQATDLKEIRVEPEMAPVDFQMQPGGRIRVRVLDEQGRPMPKTRIFLQRWRGMVGYLEFNHANMLTDDKGIWEWHEAPLDQFVADIDPPNSMQLWRQPLLARDEEYVFRVSPPLVISGSVIDVITKEPIKKFQVLPGSLESVTAWEWRYQLTATDGKYSIRRTHGPSGHRIRIEATGYQPAISRDIASNEGKVTIDFQLQKGKDLAAIVLTPDGQPAARAKAALGVARSQISLRNGDLNTSSTFAMRQETDKAGRFRFPLQDAEVQLVITHPSGFAYLAFAPDSPPESIKLQRWARVEGTFRVGKSIGANVPMSLYADSLASFAEGDPSIYTHYEATTSKDGRYVFERVVPGRVRVARRMLLMAVDGAVDITSSCRIAATAASGETTHLDLGGTGRPVIGRLQPPAGFQGKVDWRFALIHASLDIVFPPKPTDPPIPPEIANNLAERVLWMQKWQLTPAGQAYLAWSTTVQALQRQHAANPFFSISVAGDGTFRIDDVPEGNYSLSARFDRQGPGRLTKHRFEVGPMKNNRSDDPLDLGVLVLE